MASKVDLSALKIKLKDGQLNQNLSIVHLVFYPISRLINWALDFRF